MRYGYRNGNYNVIIDTKTGTKIRFTHDDEFHPRFAESVDVTITYKCDGGCPFCYADCTPQGKHADLMSREVSLLIDSLHPHTELALNGNDLTIPHLEEFLTKIKYKHVLANLTVNQKHFVKNIDLLMEWAKKDLIKGLGVSLSDATDENLFRIKEFPGAILHTVAGILTENDLELLKNKDIKLLILGYKQKGRGTSYYSQETKQNIETLKNLLPSMLEEKWFNLISFDNLALEQLAVKNLLTKEEWEQTYMGDDAKFTFFVDLVNKTFAGNSLTNDTHPITDWDIIKIFQMLQEENK